MLKYVTNLFSFVVLVSSAFKAYSQPPGMLEDIRHQIERHVPPVLGRVTVKFEEDDQGTILTACLGEKEPPFFLQRLSSEGSTGNVDIDDFRRSLKRYTLGAFGNVPPEVNSLIFYFSDVNGTLALSSTCKGLRELSLNETYGSRIWRRFLEERKGVLVGKVEGEVANWVLYYGLVSLVERLIKSQDVSKINEINELLKRATQSTSFVREFALKAVDRDEYTRALYNGNFGQDLRPEKDRFEELLEYAHAGWLEARSYVAISTYEGKLGQGLRPEQDRFGELLEYAHAGWEQAQDIIVEALNDGNFGQGLRPEQDRFEELLEYARAGWLNAQYKVVQALYSSYLGQGLRPEQERFKELQGLARAGWKPAQYYIARALYGGELGQGLRPEQDRFEELLEYARAGWKPALSNVALSIYNGELGQGHRPEQDGFRELLGYALAGWKEAQEMVAEALYGGILGQGLRPEQDRFGELLEYARAGWLKAQHYVALSTYEGKLGQDLRLNQDRFKDLQWLALAGEQEVQGYVALSTYEGKLGQGLRPKQDRFEDLLKYTLAGWPGAKDMVFKGSKLFQEKQNHISFQQFNNFVELLYKLKGIEIDYEIEEYFRSLL